MGWDGKRETIKRMLSSIVYRKETTTEDILDMRCYSADVHKEGRAAWQRAYLFGEIPDDIKLALSTESTLDRLEIPGICLYGRNDEILPTEDLGYKSRTACPTSSSSTPTSAATRARPTSPTCSPPS